LYVPKSRTIGLSVPARLPNAAITVPLSPTLPQWPAVLML
jgi:hypothetical protein